MYKIIFEDPDLLVLEKEAGVVVTSSETYQQPTLEETLKLELAINLERSGIVHRLDKDTSGLMVVAKTTDSFANLQNQFKMRVVKKEYLALVHGWLKQSGKVDLAIGRNPGNREKFTVFDEEGEGKDAVTEYTPEGNFQIPSTNFQEIFDDLNKIQTRKIERMNYNQFTKVRCFPLTGRTHQIRVHLKYTGFPIVADEKYGGRKVVRLDKRWCSRQFLHAAKLSFDHPVTGKRLNFESQLPQDLQNALSKLRPLGDTA